MGVSGKPLQGLKVLVAEDEPILALDIAILLSEAGAEVIGPAGNVARALELAQTECGVRCAVLDVRLGNQSVFPVAQLLRKKGVHLVFFTGEANPQTIKQDWPDAEVVMKPCPMPALLQAVVKAWPRAAGIVE